MKTITLFTAILWASLTANAQITFEKTYGGNDEDRGYSVLQTNDNGYIICGNTKSFGAGMEDVYLIKTDENGTIQWEKTYGTSGQEIAHSIQPTNDNGFVICSENFYTNGVDSISLIKINESGDIKWRSNFSKLLNERGNYAEQTSDNGYIICGTNDAGGYQMYLIKTDADGEKEWEKTFGGTAGDEDASIVHQTEDGGFILCGSTSSYGAGDKDIFIVKTDPSGNFLWQKTFGGADWDRGANLQITSDKGFIICGETVSLGQDNADFYLVKTNQNGDLEWQHTYGGTEEEEGTSVQQTSDNGYIICGRTQSYGNGSSDVYIVKTDDQGNFLWDQTFGSEDWDEGLSISKTNDNGFIVSGNYGGYSGPAVDVYLIKTDVDGHILGTNENLFQEFNSIVYPNPCNGIFNIELRCFDKDITSIEIYNVNNLMICKRNFEKNRDGIIQADLSYYAKGIYFVKVQTFSGSVNKMLVIQ